MVVATKTTFHDERGPAIHFAERKAELGRLQERLTALCATGSHRDGLLLITGVPGAGKTELASVFAHGAMAAPVGEHGRRVRTLTVGTPALDDDAEMFMAIASALGGGGGGKAARKAVGATRRTTGVSLTVAGTGGGFSKEAGLRPPASLGGMLQRTAQGRNGRMWKGKALSVVAEMTRRGRREIDQDAAQCCVDDAGMDGKTAVADAVQHGVLTRSADGLVSFGIPSFHDYLHRELALKLR